MLQAVPPCLRGELSSFSSRGGLRAAFLDGDDAVDGHVVERVSLSARPADFNRLDLLILAHAEVYAQVVLRIVAAARTYFVNLVAVRRHATDARADGVAVRLHSDEFDGEPVVFRARLGAEQFGVGVDGVDENVYSAVVVEVAEGAAARRRRFGDRPADPFGDVL